MTKKKFNPPAVGIVWGGKADYSTWFGNVPNFIQGINFLPVTAGSLYLALMPEKLKQNIDFLAEANNTYQALGDIPALLAKIYFWSDIIWSVEALYDPNVAAKNFTANQDYSWENAPGELDPSQPQVRGERGDSKARTYHWIFNLKELGVVDPMIFADAAHYAVFQKNGTRKYVVYNPKDQEIEVHFTDQKAFKVAPHQLAVFQ